MAEFRASRRDCLLGLGLGPGRGVWCFFSSAGTETAEPVLEADGAGGRVLYLRACLPDGPEGIPVVGLAEPAPRNNDRVVARQQRVPLRVRGHVRHVLPHQEGPQAVHRTRPLSCGRGLPYIDTYIRREREEGARRVLAFFLLG